MQTDAIVTDEGLVALLDASTRARKQALELIDLAEQSASADPAMLAPMLERAAEIARGQRLLVANVAQLRTLHRKAYFSARDTKTQTAEARQEVDRLHLQLQNLYYEQRHLQGEIAACENYESVYLIPAYSSYLDNIYTFVLTASNMQPLLHASASYFRGGVSGAAPRACRRR